MSKVHRFLTSFTIAILCLTCLHHQALADEIRGIKMQWPIDWTRPEIQIDNSLYHRVSNGDGNGNNHTQPVATQIPDAQYAHLLPVSQFSLVPPIRSVLYANEDKIILVNYSPDGRYIAHRILAVATPQTASTSTNTLSQSHIYAHIFTHTPPSIVFYEDGSIYGGYTLTNNIVILPDGQFAQTPPEYSTLNTTDDIAFFTCSSNGLNGTYPLHEPWTLIDPRTQSVRNATTIGYWSDFLGDPITLTHDIFHKSSQKLSYGPILAFKGNLAPENIRFLPSQAISETEFNRLTQSVAQNLAFYHLVRNFSQLVLNTDEQQAPYIVLAINESLRLVTFSVDWRCTLTVLIHLDAHGQPTTLSYLQSSNIEYYLFEVNKQPYLLNIRYGEGAAYHLLEIHEHQIHLKALIGFACC